MKAPALKVLPEEPTPAHPKGLQETAPGTLPESPDDAPPPYLLPRFDPAWLPAPLRQLAVSHAGYLGVPLEMVALQPLGLVSAIAGASVDVRPDEGWREPATLYTLTIADSGAGKSPAMQPFTRLLIEAEKKWREGKQAAYEARLEDCRKQVAEAQKLAQMAKAGAVALKNGREQIKRLERERARLESDREKATKALRRLDEQVLSARAELESLQRENAKPKKMTDSETKVKGLERSRIEAESQKAEQEARLAEIEAQLKGQVAELETLEAAQEEGQGEAESPKERLNEAREQLKRLERADTSKPTLWVTDVTDERLATKMQENGGVAVVWSAEPKFFRVAAGAYTKDGGPAMDVMLNAHSGDWVRVERQTAPPILVDRPRLTINLMSQPKPVEDFLEKTADGRGEIARFLMCVPPDVRGHRKPGPPVPERHWELARECVRGLARLTEKPPMTMPLSDQAQSRLERWKTEHERNQRPGGPWREPAAWVSKMPGLVLRLAGLIHVAEFVVNRALGQHIPLDALERAIAIAEWGLVHAREVYRVAQQNPVSRNLERLRAVLRNEPGTLRSDLWKKLKGSMGIRNAADLERLLQELGRCGELRREKATGGPKGGRPGERYFLIDGSGGGFRQ